MFFIVGGGFHAKAQLNVRVFKLRIFLNVRITATTKY
jgi:hypothetical protein